VGGGGDLSGSEVVDAESAVPADAQETAFRLMHPDVGDEVGVAAKLHHVLLLAGVPQTQQALLISTCKGVLTQREYPVHKAVQALACWQGGVRLKKVSHHRLVEMSAHVRHSQKCSRATLLAYECTSPLRDHNFTAGSPLLMQKQKALNSGSVRQGASLLLEVCTNMAVFR